ncbi:MAG: gamma-glutamylcyclotransferase [Acidobacteriota bacterium]|nr:gamma-glutamylcyclotransferase [Acidobacteriota bacterium]
MEPLWVFGYGSLMWRPDIPFTESRVGYIKGWTRRFYQGSTDHRGVPGKPGRVVTLLPEDDAICWGRALHVPDEAREAVLDNLDHREKGGYDRQSKLFYPEDKKIPPFQVLVYRASMENPNYLGPAPMRDMARQILHAHGPSGPNREYLERLAQYLEAHDLKDDHVTELARHLHMQTAS